MTKEQALNYLRSSGFSSEQIKEIVKALEQEPLNKIRAEIMSKDGLEEALEIIDKYARSEDYSDYATVRHCLDITNKYIRQKEREE